MQYTVNIDSTAAYRLHIRHAGLNTNTTVNFELNGVDITGNIELPSTGDWQNWRTSEYEKLLLLPEGKHKLKFENNTGGSNLSFFEFEPVGNSSLVDFDIISGSLIEDGKTIQVVLSKDIDPSWEANTEGFIIKANDGNVVIETADLYPESDRIINLFLDERLSYNDKVTLNYSDGNVMSFDGYKLSDCEDFLINNLLPARHHIPGKIQAEDWKYQEGLSLEETQDVGGGYNFGFTSTGDFADYLVNISQAGNYDVNLRVASTNSNGIIRLILIDDTNEAEDDADILEIDIPNTGGWQSWQTITGNAKLPEGNYILRLYIVSPEFNVNWIEFETSTSTEINSKNEQSINIYPNPCSHTLNLQHDYTSHKQEGTVYITDITGRIVLKQVINLNEKQSSINVSALKTGFYTFTIQTKETTTSSPLIISR